MEILSSRLLVHPTDLEKSRRFYRDVLGLHVYREFGPPSAPGVVFFLGGGFLELSGRSDAVAADGVMVWLQVPSLQAAHEQLVAAGATIDEPPEAKPWGLREMRARDPDGLQLIFVEIPEDHPLRRDPR